MHKIIFIKQRGRNLSAFVAIKVEALFSSIEIETQIKLDTKLIIRIFLRYENM